MELSRRGPPAGVRAMRRGSEIRRGMPTVQPPSSGLPYDVSMSDDCLFCRIVAGTTDALVVFEDEASVAFLDHRPLFAGHTLLVPRQHVDTLTDLPAAAIGPLFANAQGLCGAVEEALGADGTFVAINNRVSQSVPHLHVHIVPRRKKDGLRGFFWPRAKYRDAAEAEEVRVSVRNAMIRWKSPLKS